MAKVRFGPVLFDASLVVFDKDGTLIDFDAMWARLAKVWVERLVAGGDDPSLAGELYRSLGYDAAAGRTDPQSPLAIATTGQLQAIAAGTVYRAGVPWPEAEDRVRWAFDTEDELPLASLIEPAGDVAGLLESLHKVGVGVAVVTTDHRRETEETLRILEITHLVDHMVCGDDGFPSKPAPDMLLATCEQLGIAPVRCAVVGDTLGDLLMAQRAGAGLRVAVLTGAGDRAALQNEADAVLDSVDDITVAEEVPDR
jgi:phosphoglycolate phosphatase